MGKQSNRMLIVLVVAAFFAIGSVVGTVFAQGKAAAAPQTRRQLRQAQVDQLVQLMDTDKDGKISKKEWMAFFEAEFDRLDVNKTGQLTPKELALSRVVVVRPSASAGK